MIRFTVPGVPTAKGRPRFVRATGRTYTPADTERAERGVAQVAAEAMAGRKPLLGPVELLVVFTFLWPASTTKKRRADPCGYWMETRPDADNLLKLVKDSCNGIVWKDDGQIARMTVEKHRGDVTDTRVFVRPLATAGGLFEQKALQDFINEHGGDEDGPN